MYGLTFEYQGKPVDEFLVRDVMTTEDDRIQIRWLDPPELIHAT